MRLRLAVSIVLLVGVSWLVDVRDVLSRLGRMESGWVAAALLLSIVQVGVSAWRWRFTAARLGLELPLAAAVREYYLATFLNQVLPGGVMGDVSRAWRHVQTEQAAEAGPVVRAVVLERASGQIVMTLVALVSMASLALTWGGGPLPVLGGLAVAAGGGVALLVWVRRHDVSRDTLAGRITHDTRVALLARDAFIRQVLSSLVVVGSYLATFLVAARAVHVDTPWPTLLPLLAPVLLAMLLPVTIAGWGLREGAAAALWSSVGLTAADGVAVSVAYGLVVLLGSLPGAAVLLRSTRPSR